MKTLILLNVAASIFGVIDSQSWNYNRFDTKTSSGNHNHLEDKDNWPLECRVGKSQSPIAIETNDAVNQRMPPIQFINYDRPLATEISNTGATVDIKFEENLKQPSIRGSILQSDYTLDNIHFHWPGEHTIDGKRYALEAHFVHYKTKARNLETALNFKDGVVVLSVLYKISGDPNEVFDDFTEYIEEIAHQVGQSYKLQNPIIPSNMLPTHTDSYFTYRGSLTTPNCDEAVLWFVFPHHSHISQTQLDDLTDIYTRDDKPLLTNSRPLQNLYGREVLFTKGVHRCGRRNCN